MNVLLLCDFSEVAINAVHYAMDLLQHEQVNFTLLNIYTPEAQASQEAQEEKSFAVRARLKERVKKLKERSSGRPHEFVGHYSEEKLVDAARNFSKAHQVDLLVMGAVGKKYRHTTILGDHTYEIISKVKCNILAVPENMKFDKLEEILMPLDNSISFRFENLQFLSNNRFFKNKRLSVWEVVHGSKKEDVQKMINKEIFGKFNDMQVKFSSLEDVRIYDKIFWKKVQKEFDLVVLFGKNLKICDRLMHNTHGLYTSMPNRLPILVLHD